MLSTSLRCNFPQPRFWIEAAHQLQAGLPFYGEGLLRPRFTLMCAAREGLLVRERWPCRGRAYRPPFAGTERNGCATGEQSRAARIPSMR